MVLARIPGAVNHRGPRDVRVVMMATVRSPREAVPAVGEDADRRAQLEGLYRAHYRDLVRMACLLVDRQEAAEEIVQDAFVRLHASLDRIEDPGRRVAYLRSIVMNLARDRLRHRGVVRRHAPRPEPPGAGADASTVRHEDAREVIEALGRLPERQREALVLRFYADCSPAEIAEAMGISGGAVKSHLHRAMKAMAEQLGEDR